MDYVKWVVSWVQAKFTAKSFTSTEVQTENDHDTSSICILCYDRERNCVLLKCGHVCMCYECAMDFKRHRVIPRRLAKCPICCKSILAVYRIYNA